MDISITYKPNFSVQKPDGTWYIPSAKTVMSSDVQSIALLPPDNSQLDFYADGYRDGYVFVEWNTASDGSGTSYQPGDSVSENLELYAIWLDQTYIVKSTELTSIAKAIRAKSGKSASMEFPNGFVTEVGKLKPAIRTLNLEPVTISVVTIKYGSVSAGERITSYYSIPGDVYIDENTVITAECENPTYQGYYGNYIEGVYEGGGLYVKMKQAHSAMTKGITIILTFTPIAKAVIDSN